MQNGWANLVRIPLKQSLEASSASRALELVLLIVREEIVLPPLSEDDSASCSGDAATETSQVVQVVGLHLERANIGINGNQIVNERRVVIAEVRVDAALRAVEGVRSGVVARHHAVALDVLLERNSKLDMLR